MSSFQVFFLHSFLLLTLVFGLSWLHLRPYLAFKSFFYEYIFNWLSYLHEHYSELQIYVASMTVISVGVYWLWGAMYAAFDYLPNATFVHSFKVQVPKTERRNDWRPNPFALRRLVYVVLRNQFVVFLLTFVLYHLFKWRNTDFMSLAHMPSLRRTLFQLVLIAVIYDIFFYVFHFSFHYFSFLYQRFHKAHHEWPSPIGWQAAYCHWLEHIVVNLSPMIIALLAIRSHVIVHWVWAFVATAMTVTHHSGYHLPFIGSPEFHDFHHLSVTNNFGLIGFMDYVFGTDERWTKSYQIQLHRMFWTVNGYIQERKRLMRYVNKTGKLVKSKLEMSCGDLLLDSFDDM